MNNGLEIGLKNGMGLAQLNNGLCLGLHSNVFDKAKMIDPSTLDGAKLPIFFFNGESTTNTGPDSLISAVDNLSRSNYGLVKNSDPMFKWNWFRTRSGIQNDTNDSIYTTTNTYLNGKNELTVFFVASIDTTSTYNLMWKVSTTSFDTIGDIVIEGVGGNKIRSTFIGNPIANQSIVESFLPEVKYAPVLVCIKYQLGNKTAPEQKMYINGVLNQKYTDSSYTTAVGDTFQSNSSPFYFGANSSFVGGGGGVLGTALVLPYWANDSEQFMIENWLRWYYGYKF
jgi:hypothetical protein